LIWAKYIDHGVNVAEWLKARGWEPRSKVVGSIPSHASNFQPLDNKKINKPLSVGILVICSVKDVTLALL